MDNTSLIFQPITTAAMAIVSAGIVLTVTWRKTADLPLPNLAGHSRAIWRTAALFSGVLVAALYIGYDHCSDWPVLRSLSLVSLTICLLALLGHILLARDRKWTNGQNGLIKAGIVVLYFAWNVGGTCALTGAAKAILFKREAQQMHREIGLMRLDPITDKFIPIDAATPIKTKPRLPVYLHENIHECEGSQVEWSLIPETGAGSIDRSGTYTAPEIVGDQPLRAKVKVLSLVHRARDENATIDIIVEPEIRGIVREPKKLKQNGSEAVYDVMVITSEYAWACESETALTSQRGGREVVTDFAKSGAFHGYQDLLALGTASHEGERGQEDARADRRAESLAKWMKAALSAEELRNIGVYSVNLGQYHTSQKGAQPRPCSIDTADERPLVIIGVVRRDSKIDLEKGLEQVFSQNRDDSLFNRIFQRYPPPWRLMQLN